MNPGNLDWQEKAKDLLILAYNRVREITMGKEILRKKCTYLSSFSQSNLK